MWPDALRGSFCFCRGRGDVRVASNLVAGSVLHRVKTHCDEWTSLRQKALVCRNATYQLD